MTKCPKGAVTVKAIHLSEKTDKEGTLLLRLPLGKPETEYEVMVVFQPSEAAVPATPEERGWSPGYFGLIGSIDGVWPRT